jgi:hypothetical protein
MPLFLVTGLAGTGKSTICNELRSLGIAAYDVDEDGLAKWQHNTTRFIHPKSSVSPHQRTPEFLEQHSWNVPREDIEALAKQASDRPVFMCGVIGNEDEVYDLFRTVYVLYLDDAALEQRLRERPGDEHVWGKQAHERELTLGWNDHFHKKHVALGNIMIDAGQPISEVLSRIVETSEVRKT